MSLTQEPGTADRDRQVLVDEEALDELEQQTFYDVRNNRRQNYPHLLCNYP